MSDNEHRIMNIVSDDAPDRASPEHIREMLQDLESFVSKHKSDPGKRKFKDWSESYSPRSYVRYFGGWNDAVEAVGGEPNDKNEVVSHHISEKEALDALDNAAEQRIEYKVDGENKVSPKGEAPPAGDLQHIDSEDLPGESTYSEKFDRTYTELAIERGHDTASHPSPNGAYDTGEVRETLKNLTREEIYWRAEDTYIDAGDIPPTGFINKHDDLPQASTLTGWYGPRDDWPQELGLEEKRNANDVDVDLSNFGDPSNFG